jgi:hypothetical protein
LNIASALLLAPPLAEADAADEPLVLGDWVVLGAVGVLAELLPDALSPVVWADNGRANAAATAAAIRVLSFIIISSKLIKKSNRPRPS